MLCQFFYYSFLSTTLYTQLLLFPHSSSLVWLVRLGVFWESRVIDGRKSLYVFSCFFVTQYFIPCFCMISDLYVMKISLIFYHFVSCMIVNGVCVFELVSMGFVYFLDCWGSGDLNMGTSRSVSWVTRLPWSCRDLLNQWFQWVSIGVGIIDVC